MPYVESHCDSFLIAFHFMIIVFFFFLAGESVLNLLLRVFFV